MKGYTLNNTMYVFPQTVGAIPYVGESVTSIMVQQEDLAAWKTANSDYASIMKAYNYNMMTVQKKVWADHLDDDIVVPEPPVTLYTVSLTSGAQELVPMIQSALTEQSQYEENDSVSLVQEYSGEYTNLDGYYWSLTDEANNTTNYEFEVALDETTGDPTSASIDFTMPASDVELDIQQKNEHPMFYSFDGENATETAIVTLGADDNVFPYVVGADFCDSVSYTSTDESCATVDENGTITLFGEGETLIVCDGVISDAAYYGNPQAYYTLTVYAAPDPGPNQEPTPEP